MGHCVFCLCLTFSDSTRKIISYKNILEADLLEPLINGVGSESLFDSTPVIPLLLVNNNGIIPS